MSQAHREWLCLFATGDGHTWMALQAVDGRDVAGIATMIASASGLHLPFNPDDSKLLVKPNDLAEWLRWNRDHGRRHVHFLWHGTGAANVQGIAVGGLDARYWDIMAHGPGHYFARDLRLALKYSETSGSADAPYVVFLALLCTDGSLGNAVQPAAALTAGGKSPARRGPGRRPHPASASAAAGGGGRRGGNEGATTVPDQTVHVCNVRTCVADSAPVPATLPALVTVGGHNPHLLLFGLAAPLLPAKPKIMRHSFWDTQANRNSCHVHRHWVGNASDGPNVVDLTGSPSTQAVNRNQSAKR